MGFKFFSFGAGRERLEQFNSIPTPEQQKTAQEIKDLIFAEQTKMAETLNFSSQTKITEKSRELEKKYPNVQRVYMYHILATSSPKDGEVFDAFDFQGGDSIVSFVRKELSQPPGQSKTAHA
jgi:hypothetical protein